MTTREWGSLSPDARAKIRLSRYHVVGGVYITLLL